MAVPISTRDRIKASQNQPVNCTAITPASSFTRIRSRFIKNAAMAPQIILTIANIRTLRGHFTPKSYMGVEVTGIYWHFVDVMWIIVFLTVYIL